LQCVILQCSVNVHSVYLVCCLYCLLVLIFYLFAIIIVNKKMLINITVPISVFTFLFTIIRACKMFDQLAYTCHIASF